MPKRPISILVSLPPQTTNPIKFLLFATRPHVVLATSAIVTVTLGSILGAFVPYVYKIIIDAAGSLGTGSYGSLWHAAFLYIGVLLLGTVINRISGFIAMRWFTSLRATATASLSAYVTKHSHTYFSERFAGSLANRVAQAANGTDGFTQALLWQFLTFVVSLITSFIIVFLTSPLLAGILFLMFAIITPLNVFLARRRIPLSERAQEEETKVSGATVDVLSNISAVHDFARREYELSYLTDLIISRKQASRQSWRYSEVTLLINNVIQNIAIGALLLVAILLATRGSISPGDIILLLTMISLLENQLTFIGTRLNDFADLWGSISSSLKDILAPYDLPDPEPAPSLMITSGELTFRDVVFRYGSRTIFDGLTFTIPAGQRVGIVGRSGAGKSTLIRLILRHYAIESGQILIDGTNIAMVSKDSLRTAVAVVPQEPALFHRTVMNNIAYGNPHATLADVASAADQAQASAFIDMLPQKYETMVGERGTKLSGGQRQRIAIARAILKNAPILLMDEATSALDSESEALIQEALLGVMQGRTVLAVAHRLSTLRAMDRILVFDQGAIIEDGTHEELIAAGSIYASLWQHQAGGFLREQ